MLLFFVVVIVVCGDRGAREDNTARTRCEASFRATDDDALSHTHTRVYSHPCTHTHARTCVRNNCTIVGHHRKKRNRRCAPQGWPACAHGRTAHRTAPHLELLLRRHRGHLDRLGKLQSPARQQRRVRLTLCTYPVRPPATHQNANVVVDDGDNKDDDDSDDDRRAQRIAAFNVLNQNSAAGVYSLA